MSVTRPQCVKQLQTIPSQFSCCHLVPQINFFCSSWLHRIKRCLSFSSVFSSIDFSFIALFLFNSPQILLGLKKLRCSPNVELFPRARCARRAGRRAPSVVRRTKAGWWRSGSRRLPALLSGASLSVRESARSDSHFPYLEARGSRCCQVTQSARALLPGKSFKINLQLTVTGHT